MVKLITFCCSAVLIFSSLSFAQNTKEEGPAVDQEAVHTELRTLRDAILAGVKKGNIDEILNHVDEKIVFIGIDGRLIIGADALRQYFDKMMKGPDRIVDAVNFNLDVKELTSLYNGTAGTSYGTSSDHYDLTDGSKFDVQTSWSATLVRKNNRWLVASFHSSVNAFDNPLINATKKYFYMILAAAVVVAFLLGMGALKLLRKR